MRVQAFVRAQGYEGRDAVLVLTAADFAVS
jgi:hypothetical protein